MQVIADNYRHLYYDEVRFCLFKTPTSDLLGFDYITHYIKNVNRLQFDR